MVILFLIPKISLQLVKYMTTIDCAVIMFKIVLYKQIIKELQKNGKKIKNYTWYYYILINVSHVGVGRLIYS